MYLPRENHLDPMKEAGTGCGRYWDSDDAVTALAYHLCVCWRVAVFVSWSQFDIRYKTSNFIENVDLYDTY